MRMVDLIIKKKEGNELSKDELKFIIDGFVSGSIPDYQVSSLLMAICFKGLNDMERYELTTIMEESGDKIDLSSIDGICVDKHSTGGVGDKTTLVVAPIVSACGLKVAKMSGRGLGHTGGTLDKLESIPGFTIEVNSDDFFKQVKEIGIAVIGQTANITPADKLLYALRDVTGTVDNIGLIASSIMSKKLASGAHTITLDVKVGDGAFMKNLDQARELAEALVAIGKRAGRDVSAVITDMEEPLGEMVGNSLEVIEAIETLKGRGPNKFMELCIELSSELLYITKVASSMERAKTMVLEKIASHEALEKLKEMIIFQGGNPNVIDDYSLLPTAETKKTLMSKESGWVEKVEALKIGKAAMLLGAGRESKEDTIDKAVGIEVLKHVGDFVEKGEAIAVIYSNGRNEKEAEKMIYNAYSFSKEEIESRKIILDIVR